MAKESIHEKRKKSFKIRNTEIPVADAGPKWVNPTAYVLAKKNRDGHLEEVYLEHVSSSIDNTMLCDLISAALGVVYTCQRQVFKNNANLEVSVLSDALYQKAIDAAATDRLRGEETIKRATTLRKVPVKKKRGRRKK